MLVMHDSTCMLYYFSLEGTILVDVHDWVTNSDGKITHRLLDIYHQKNYGCELFNKFGFLMAFCTFLTAFLIFLIASHILNMIKILRMQSLVCGKNSLSFLMSNILMILPNEEQCHTGKRDEVLWGSIMDLRMSPDNLSPGL